jgi:hypothetical protein
MREGKYIDELRELDGKRSHIYQGRKTTLPAQRNAAQKKSTKLKMNKRRG